MSIIQNYSAYQNSYFFPENSSYFYIHLHQQNIGKANGGNAVDPGQVASNYQNNKMDQAYKGSKNQFLNLYKQTIREISGDKSTLRLLNSALNNNSNTETIMTSIFNQMAQKLRQSLAIDKMSALRETYEKISSQQIAQSILKSESVVQSCNALNTLLDAMSDAAALLSKEGSGLREVLIAAKRDSAISISDLGEGLQTVLNEYEQKNKTNRSYNINQALLAANSIKSLAKALKNGIIEEENNRVQNISVKGLSRIINNIFSGGFAQAVSSQIYKRAKDKTFQTIRTALVGSKTTKIQFTDEKGNIRQSESIAEQGKADVLIKNVKATISISNNNIELTLKSVGLSDKFYKSNRFVAQQPDNSNYESVGTLSGGGAGSLQQAIETLFNNPYDRYIAYNVVAHRANSDWSETYTALQKLIIMRQATVRGFASRGGVNDFAQFIFANGQVFPIWDILMSVYRSTENINSELFPVRIEIKKEDSFSPGTWQHFIPQRTIPVNELINKAYIKFHIRTGQLARLKSEGLI